MKHETDCYTPEDVEDTAPSVMDEVTEDKSDGDNEDLLMEVSKNEVDKLMFYCPKTRRFSAS